MSLLKATGLLLAASAVVILVSPAGGQAGDDRSTSRPATASTDTKTTAEREPLMKTPLKVGVARLDITPPVRISRSGKVFPIGTPLYATAIVLECGKKRIAIVCADTQLFFKDQVSVARKRIKQLTGIPADHVMLNSSHTHAGGPLPWNREEGGKEYLVFVAKKCADAVFMADKVKRPALVGYARGNVNLAINRWKKKDWGVRWGPNPDGPADQELTLVRFDSLDHTPIAFLASYASHPTVSTLSGGTVHGDFPFFLREALERAYPGSTALFATGTGGDIKIAFLNEDKSNFRYGTVDDARRFGSIFGAEAVKLAKATKTVPVRSIAIASTMVKLPLYRAKGQESVRRELADAEKNLKKIAAQGAGQRIARMSVRRLQRLLDAYEKGDKVVEGVPVEVQVITLGDHILISGVPGEPMAEIGMGIKKAFPNRCVIPLGFTNEYVGYIPSRYMESIGWCNYGDSPWGRPTSFSGASEDILIKTVKDLAGKLDESRKK